MTVKQEPLSELDAGLLIGVLIGEGHFGGDGRQPQITLRMHTDHEALFRWLVERVAGSRLYGPYHHGGRSYFQWMVRGESLRRLLPLLDRHLSAELDRPSFERYLAMKQLYRLEAKGSTIEANASSPSPEPES